MHGSEDVVGEFRTHFAANPVVAALDDMDEVRALRVAQALRGSGLGALKISTLLHSPDAGPQVVQSLRSVSCGAIVWADVKAHDIPNTVARSVRNLRAAGARIITVHANGGRAMLKAALEAAVAKDLGSPALILAVTVLTSLDDADCREIYGTQIPTAESGGAVHEAFLRLTKIGVESGVHGFVMSPLELALFRKIHPNFPGLLVTPGVRPVFYNPSGTEDQKRVATPAEAKRDGANAIVLGRPLFESGETRANLDTVLRELGIK
jgi:orotidine-5'-phosphate decarboxylase